MHLLQHEQLEREIEKNYIRTTPLGKDRFHNRYWFFFREGRLFVESDDSARWGYYSAKEEVVYPNMLMQLDLYSGLGSSS